MTKVTIVLTGEYDDDLTIALAEVQRLIEAGFSSGFGSNKSGSYNFSSEETS